MNPTLRKNHDEALALAKYRKGNFLILAALAAVLALSAKSLRAQTNAYWDVNGTTTGQGGTGTFSSANAFWTTNAVNASANSGGPISGGLFAVTNGSAGTSTNTNSGGYIFNFGGTAGTVTAGGNFSMYGINVLTNGYVFSSSANRTYTMSNGYGFNLSNYSTTFANGASGANSITLLGDIVATNGAAITLSSTNAGNGNFGFYVNNGTVSSNATITIQTLSTNRVLIGINSSSSNSTFNSAIVNNSSGGTPLELTNTSGGNLTFNGVISGSNAVVVNNWNGKLILNGANTYTGGTTINSANTSGQVEFGSSSAFGSGSITIGSAGTNYVRANVNNLNITNAMAVNAGSVLRLGATNTGHKSTWSGAITGGGSILYSVSDNGLYLTATNSSFSGGVTIGSSGKLFATSFGMAGSNSSLGTNGTITVSGSSGASTLQWLGTSSETSDKTISLTGTNASTAGITIYAGDNTAGVGGTNVTLTLNGNINSTANANQTITLGSHNTNSLVVNGVINQAAGYTTAVVVSSSGSSSVTLGSTNNTFGGAVTLNGGSASTTTLSVAKIGNAGFSSSLGTNGTINLGGTSATGYNVLKYVGSGETSDKVINLAGTLGGATLDQSGAGNLKFTSTMTATGAGTKSLTLQGSTAGTGEVASAISDLGGNVISLTKAGTGTWTLSGDNTFTGGTTINGGTLATSAADKLADSGTVTINNTGILKLGGNETVAAVAGSTNTATLNLQSYTLTVGGAGSGFTNSALTIGSGSIVKNGTNLIYLNNSGNTYSGGFTLNGGEVAYTSSGTYGVGGITSTVFGTGTLTINGGTIRSSSDTSGRNIANNIILNGDIQFGAAGAAAGITVTNLAGGTTTLTKDVTITSFAAVDYKQAINGAAYRLTYNGTNYYNSSNSLNQFSLQASNNIAGVTVNAGTVGYKNRNSFGNGDLILANGVVVGQDGSINNTGLTGNDRTDRAIANNILLNGNVTFGLGGTANYLGGNMDLGGATRTITLGNTTYQYGAVTNGGLVIDNGTAPNSRAFSLFASNSYSGGTVVRTNAIFAVGHDQALGTGNLVFTNTTGSGVATLRASTLSTAASQLRTITNNIQLASGMNVTVDTVSSAQDASGNSVSVNLDTTLSGAISGGGGLTKTNSNKLTLTGNNTYSGSTTVNAGTLEVASGASIGSSATTVNSATLAVNGTAGDVTVNSGGTVKGSGTVSALSIASGGTLAVGNSPGSMTASSASWNGGGTYAWEINNFLGSAGTNYDILNVTGGLSISASSGNKFIIDVISLLASNNTAGDASNFDAYANYSFAIATAAGGITGFSDSYFDIVTSGFSNSMLPAGAAGPGSWSISQSGNSINLNYAAAIPEPGTGALFLVGLGLVVLARQRKRAEAATE